MVYTFFILFSIETEPCPITHLSYIVYTVDIADGNYVLRLSLYLLGSLFPRKVKSINNNIRIHCTAGLLLNYLKWTALSLNGHGRRSCNFVHKPKFYKVKFCIIQVYGRYSNEPGAGKHNVEQWQQKAFQCI